MRTGLLLSLTLLACGSTASPSAPPRPADDRPRSLAVQGMTVCILQEGAPYCWGGYLRDRPVAVPVPEAERFVGPGICVVAADTLRCWERPLMPGEAITVRPGEGPIGARRWIDECAERADERWVCPGQPLAWKGEASVRFDAPSRVVVGDGSICAIEAGGRVRCAGPCATLELPTSGARDVAISLDQICVLGPGDEVACAYTHGTDPLAPVALPRGAGPVTRLLGSERIGQCALHEGGRVTCWSREEPPRALDVPPGTVELAVGGRSDVTYESRTWCARTADGEVLCRGDGREGQLGPLEHGVEVERPVRVAIDDVRSFALGRHRGCAITGEGVRCWGHVSETEVRFSPGPWPGVDDALEVALGGENTCARTHDGSVLCDGPVVPLREASASRTPMIVWSIERELPARPVPVEELQGAEQLAVGIAHACGRMPDSTVRCVGAASFELTPGVELPPGGLLGPNPPIDGVRRVVASLWTTCAHREDGEVVCWGGMHGTAARPVGRADAIALIGALLCTGDRRRLRCVDLDSDEVRLDVATDARTVTAFHDRVCATRDCWGLADGAPAPWSTIGDRLDTPPERSDVDEHGACWLRDGNLFCVGDASEGGLGDGVELITDRWVRIELPTAR